MVAIDEILCMEREQVLESDTAGSQMVVNVLY